MRCVAFLALLPLAAAWPSLFALFNPDNEVTRAKRQAYPIYTDKERLTADASGQTESGNWGAWSLDRDCSRTCGGGVLIEKRQCAGSECTGPSKRYVSCNIEACEDGGDFRAEQCAKYNDQELEGKYYKWEPAFKSKQPCELACQPTGQNFYYKWADKVIDGTLCNSMSDDICVEGVCLNVGCDGVLGSSVVEDQCRVCGGDGSSCKTVKGFFDERNLEHGYHDVIDLPVGATRISVKEMRATSNSLAIRNSTDGYLLNPNYQIQVLPTTLNIAGTQFFYDKRKENGQTFESLAAKGPLTEELVIALIYQRDSKYSAVQYEFSVPLEDVQYIYKPGEWSECSVTCGKGVHSREASCVDTASGAAVADEQCDELNATRPDTNKTCETVDCDAEWFSGDWEDCSQTCGDLGWQYRVVYCHRVFADGRKITVADDQCTADRPAYRQECNRFSCPGWNAGPWSACSEKCGDAHQYRSVTCRSAKAGEEGRLLGASACPDDGALVDRRACNLGPCDGLKFVTTPWILCEKCNDTTETREVSCEDESGRRFGLDKCEADDEQPADERDCVQVVACVYQWHSSEWSPCSTECGHGHQKRVIRCAIDQLGDLEVVDDGHCKAENKPNATQTCINEAECTGTYFMGPWTECTESCGGGSQTRTVVCLNYDRMPVPHMCDEVDEPLKQRDCNIDECPVCGDSEFGCCPDNSTFATAPFNEGCSNCTTSEFGCCADNVTEATGADFAGKPASGERERVGAVAGCPGVEVEEEEVEGSGEEEDGEKLCEVSSADGETVQVACNATDLVDDSSTMNMTGDGNQTMHCSKSEFGCCPDWYTEATGEDEDGCPTFVVGECNGTKFGCCPDEVTLSRGANMEGCGEPSCAASLYGCCKDRRTIAFGPHYDGCERSSFPCELSSHGCCPDGETAALGADGEGCGESCLFTKHGCCPDGMTLAKGAGNEGCGCAFGQYGCCADGKTAAEGLNNRGCPQSCAQSSYGCCPDGKTAARGANQQGCPCQYTTYGCCPDGETEARGPNNDGCDDCRYAKHGCCYDGLSTATGPNYEGCPATTQAPWLHGGTVSPAKIAACTLMKKGGTYCAEYTLYWHYNVTENTCQQFWYAGCDGNDNRFDSEHQCKTTCIEPPYEGVCYLPKAEGLTRCADYQLRYWYDYNTLNCQAFYWRGCGGNGNRFETNEACMQRCRGIRPPLTNVRPATRPPPPRTNPPTTTTTTTQRPAGPTWAPADYCLETSDAGPCKDFKDNFYYDKVSGRCAQFIYGGCGGNFNRFDSLYECQRRCAPHLLSQPPRSCDERMHRGHCDGSFVFFYYERALGRCIEFTYSGCGGNANRFHSEAECERSCGASTSLLPPPSTQRSQPLIRIEEESTCELDKDAGRCTAYVAQWYYRRSDGTCDRFYYGGCGGNANRFDSERACRATCADRADPCTLPKVVGPCKDWQPRYFYDGSQGRCAKFSYGGCMGNVNAFVAHADCTRRCLADRVAVVVAQPQPSAVDAPLPVAAVVPIPPPLIPDDYSICSLPQAAGSCVDDREAWYYDVLARGCVQFRYTGCGGNENRFESATECERRCAGAEALDIDESVDLDEWPTDLQPEAVAVAVSYSLPTSLLPELCKLGKDVGSCYGEDLRWYFDSEKGACRGFVYTGCGGNANRFSSAETCQRACGLYRDQDVCSSAYDAGHCDLSVPKWYFDEARQHCDSFLYSGCGGNGNRFSSSEECRNLCQAESRSASDVCSLARVAGPCRAALERWAFDATTGRCESFIFGGCQGNANNFESPQACERRCVAASADAEDVCRLGMDAGPCADATTQWFFDGQSALCKPFTYGGCRGNGNRFDTRHECEERCGGRRAGQLVVDPQEWCALPFDGGVCHASYTRWYFDASLADCRMFVYTGCGGNANRFQSQQQCRHSCVAAVALPPPQEEEYEIAIIADADEYAYGSDVLLHCQIVPPETPKYAVVWYHNGRQCDVDGDNYQALANDSLLIRRATEAASGNYTCASGLTARLSAPLALTVAAAASTQPAATTTTAPACVDGSGAQVCAQIVRAQLCTRRRYGAFCCRSCTAAGFDIPR